MMPMRASEVHNVGRLKRNDAFAIAFARIEREFKAAMHQGRARN